MPSRTTTPQSLQSEDVAQRAVEAAGAPVEESETSKRLQQTPERGDVRGKSYEYARTFWKLLVNNVGESEAKEIMHHLMGEKKPGPRVTDQGVALTYFIYAYIRHFGLNNTDGEIASRILKSSPHYLHYESGAVAVANSEFTEAYLSSADDLIVGRKPIDMGLPAIKKRVERVRRWSIKEDLLPREYVPRAYHRG
jgi:hypothetical protein